MLCSTWSSCLGFRDHTGGPRGRVRRPAGGAGFCESLSLRGLAGDLEEHREGDGSPRPSSGAEARCGDCDATLGEGEEDEDFPPPYDEVVPGLSQDGDLGEVEGAAARWGPETLV